MPRGASVPLPEGAVGLVRAPRFCSICPGPAAALAGPVLVRRTPRASRLRSRAASCPPEPARFFSAGTGPLLVRRGRPCSCRPGAPPVAACRDQPGSDSAGNRSRFAGGTVPRSDSAIAAPVPARLDRPGSDSVAATPGLAGESSRGQRVRFLLAGTGPVLIRWQPPWPCLRDPRLVLISGQPLPILLAEAAPGSDSAAAARASLLRNFLSSGPLILKLLVPGGAVS